MEKTFRQGVGMIIRGHVICAKRTWEKVNGLVTGYPWSFLVATVIVAAVASLTWMAQCKTRQTTAEWQRDSLEQRCETLEISLGERR